MCSHALFACSKEEIICFVVFVNEMWQVVWFYQKLTSCDRIGLNKRISFFIFLDHIEWVLLLWFFSGTSKEWATIKEHTKPFHHVFYLFYICPKQTEQTWFGIAFFLKGPKKRREKCSAIFVIVCIYRLLFLYMYDRSSCWRFIV